MTSQSAASWTASPLIQHAFAMQASTAEPRRCMLAQDAALLHLVGCLVQDRVQGACNVPNVPNPCATQHAHDRTQNHMHHNAWPPTPMRLPRILPCGRASICLKHVPWPPGVAYGLALRACAWRWGHVELRDSGWGSGRSGLQLSTCMHKNLWLAHESALSILQPSPFKHTHPASPPPTHTHSGVCSSHSAVQRNTILNLDQRQTCYASKRSARVHCSSACSLRPIQSEPHRQLCECAPVPAG